MEKMMKEKRNKFEKRVQKLNHNVLMLRDDQRESLTNKSISVALT